MTWPDVGDTGYVWTGRRIVRVRCDSIKGSWRRWSGPDGVTLRTNGEHEPGWGRRVCHMPASSAADAIRRWGHLLESDELSDDSVLGIASMAVQALEWILAELVLVEDGATMPEPIPVPPYLTETRDGWVRAHALTHLLPDLYDWRVKGPDNMLPHAREALVHHLRETCHEATWSMIAACVGAGSHSSVCDADRRYRIRALDSGPSGSP